MLFMLLFVEGRGASPAPAGLLDEMRVFANELAKQGTLLRGAPLAAEAEGARIRVRDGKPLVSDGPFAESKEVLGGFWILDVADRGEATEIARRCPYARHATVEVHPVRFRDAVEDPGNAPLFLFAFRMEPGVKCDDAKLQEMLGFGEKLKKERKLLETAPLAEDPPAARVETQGGRILVTDGPFAEAKEAVGGYSLVRAAERAEAIEIAKRYPHARWGTVEVREVLGVDRA